MSELIIESLHVELQPLARTHRDVAHHLGLDIIFTAGRRTWAEQMAAYGKGRSMTPHGWIVSDPAKLVTFALPEQAPHCRGAAYDIVPIVKERAAWDRLDLFAELGRIGKELGLVWGGDWPKLKDCPHFELPGWRSLPMPTGTV